MDRASVPEKLDHYKVFRKIGGGGHGDVYLAHDPHLDIEVAIKVLRADLRSTELMDRFKVDARTAVRLTHPNVVRVYSFNPQYPYIVMEFCGDGDLTGRIRRRRPQSLVDTISIARQIGAALVAAHSNKPPILHRDLKPGNVLFQGEIPKVADFGLAKMLGGAASGLTTTRGMMGTVGYASPEQLKDARAADTRTDLWSLGVILYEMLTFRRPFQKPGDDYVNVALKVRMEPPVPPSFDLPRPVWEFIQRALEKDPDNRFGSAEEMVAALDAVQAAVPQADTLVFPPKETLSEMERLASNVARDLDEGSTVDAAERIRAMKELGPEDSLWRYWSKQLRERQEQESGSGSNRDVSSGKMSEARELESRLNSVQRLIGEYDFNGALKQVGELLIRFPENSVVQKYITRVNEARTELSNALDAAHDGADKARENGDCTEVHRIWDELNAKYSGFPDIEAELAVAKGELKQKEIEKLRQGTERAAERLMQMGDTAGAIAAWDAYLRDHRADAKAMEAKQKLVDRQRSEELSERTRAVERETRKHEEAGDLAAALRIWERVLADEPAIAEAGQHVERLRLSLRQRELVMALEQTRARSASCEQSGDLRGAIAVWRPLQRDFPECSEANERLQLLREALAEQERETLRKKIDHEVALLEQRLGSGRYSGSPGARATVASALESASGSADHSQALSTLISASKQAEDELSRTLRGRRDDLRELFDRASAVLDDRGAREAALLSESREELEAAIRRAVSTLCDQVSDGDPLAPMIEAGERLQQTLDRCTEERAQAVEAARTATAEALVAAEERIRTLVDLGDTPVTGDTARLEEELSRLRSRAKVDSASRLDEIRHAASRLAAEAEAIHLGFVWTTARELRAARDSAMECFVASPGEQLEHLVRTVDGALESMDPASVSPVELAQLVRQTRAEVAAVQDQATTRMTGARDRWEEAVANWDSDLERANPEVAKAASAIRGDAENALARSQSEALSSCGDRLDSLGRRALIESAWERRKVEIQAIEEASDEADLRELLHRWRGALARGAADELKTIESEVERRAGELATRRGATRSVEPDVPVVSRGIRRFNEKHHPAGLEHFDRTMAEWTDAREEADRANMADLAERAEQAYDRLMQPPPRWRALVAPLAAAVVVCGVGVGLVWARRPALAEVTLVSAAGEARVEQVLRNGNQIDDFGEAVVRESGVRWTDLQPGEYRVVLEAGNEVSFELPGDELVVVHSSRVNYGEELLRELNLEEVINAGKP